jgi:hypothetical protein
LKEAVAMISKDVTMPHFKVLIRHSPRESEGNHKKKKPVTRAQA